MILAIETSSSRCSVALLGQDVEQQVAEDMPRGHHERLLPMVAQLLQHHAMTLENLDVIALGRGPGSFTGLRIGTGVVQGLAFGSSKPTVSVSSLYALALQAWRQRQGNCHRVLALRNAHMNEVYWSLVEFDDDGRVRSGEERLSPPNEVRLPETLDVSDLAVIGDACTSYGELAARFAGRMIDAVPEAIDVARIAQSMPVDTWRPPQDAQPLYLRGAGAWKQVGEQQASRRRRN